MLKLKLTVLSAISRARVNFAYYTMVSFETRFDRWKPTPLHMASVGDSLLVGQRLFGQGLGQGPRP